MALIKAMWDEKKRNADFIDLYVPLVAKVIKDKGYSEIEVDQLCDDFEGTYGIRVPRHPMYTILRRAQKKYKIIRQDRGKYFPDHSKIEDLLKNSRESITIQRSIEEIINKFIQFTDTQYGKKIKRTEAEEIFLNFLKSSDMELLFASESKTVLPQTRSRKWEKVAISEFLIHLSENDNTVFERVIDIATGHVLASAILFEEVSPEHGHSSFEGKYKNVEFYFDTNFIFRLLGFEGEGRKVANEELLHVLRSQKAKLFVFQHTFDEIYWIIDDSAKWLEDPLYDSSLASQVSRFFKENNFSSSDVEKLLVELQGKIESLGIEIVDVPDLDTLQKYEIDEKALYDKIVNLYKVGPGEFHEEDKKETIWKDVKSISAIYRLRKERNPKNINEVRYVFVTTNATLAYASRRYEIDVREKPFIIPTCLTSIFIGTFIWLQNPKTYRSIDKKRIIGDCVAFLEPTRELRKRLVTETKKLRDNGQISPEEYNVLNSSLVAKNLLMEKTMGDPDAFTDKTPFEILEEIKARARAEGRSEKEEEIQKIKTEKESLTERIKDLEPKAEKLGIIEERIDSRARDSAKRWTRAFIIFGIVLIIVSGFPQVFGLKPLFRVLCGVLTLVLLVFSVYFGKNLKTESGKLYNWLYEKNKLKKLKKFKLID